MVSLGLIGLIRLNRVDYMFIFHLYFQDACVNLRYYRELKKTKKRDDSLNTVDMANGGGKVDGCIGSVRKKGKNYHKHKPNKC